MADEGRSLILVSHKLHEIMQVSDRVTVLRDGQRVEETISTADATPRLLARMMVGRELDLPTRDKPADPGASVLEAKGLHVIGDRGLEAVAGISFDLRAGEVLGVAGVSGNGQRELAFALAGLRPAESGTIRLNGNDVTNDSVLARIRAGLAYVPQQRLGMGLAPGLTTPDNMALKSFRRPPFSSGPLLTKGAFNEHADELIERHDVRGVRSGLPIRLLSGGNLQKVLLAREMAEEHTVLIARSPTRGLDVGATEAVHNHVLAESESGVGVLLISEDLDELTALSDRIIVMYEGKAVGELPVQDATAERLGLLMAGHVGQA